MDHALPKIQVLLLMQQNEPALEAFRTALDGGWEESATGRAGALLRHSGACEACRLGKRSEARRLWREALDIHSDLYLALANLGELERAAEPPAFPQALEVQTLFPVRLVSVLRDLEQDAELDVVQASNAYLEAAYCSGNEVVRALASLPLKSRAGQGDSDAVRHLKAFARLPIGSKFERFGYLKFLREQDLLHGLAERERMHVSDLFTLYATLAMLHMAKGDNTTAQRSSLRPASQRC